MERPQHNDWSLCLYIFDYLCAVENETYVVHIPIIFIIDYNRMSAPCIKNEKNKIVNDKFP